MLSIIANKLDTDSFLPIPPSVHLFVKIAAIFEAGNSTKWNVHYWKDARVKAFYQVLHADFVAQKLDIIIAFNSLEISQKSDAENLMKSLTPSSVIKNNLENSRVSNREKSYQTLMTNFLKTAPKSISNIKKVNYESSRYNLPSSDCLVF